MGHAPERASNRGDVALIGMLLAISVVRGGIEMVADSCDIPGNSHARRRLVEIVQSCRAFAFVGAGASAGMYPLWGDLIEALSREAAERDLVDDEQVESWLRLAQAHSAHAACLLIRQHLGEGTYRDLLRSIFGPKTDREGREFTAVHAALVRLPFKGYITTNYDPGLLAALRRYGGAGSLGSVPTSTDGELIREWLVAESDHQLGSPILYAHGIYDRPDTIVLDTNGYRHLYRRNGPFRDLLRKLWTQEHMVFIGYGFGDPWFEFFADEVLDEAQALETAPRHVAVVGLRDEDPPGEIRRYFSGHYHAEVLFYPVSVSGGVEDHSALCDELDRLRSSSRADIYAPAGSELRNRVGVPSFAGAFASGTASVGPAPARIGQVLKSTVLTRQPPGPIIRDPGEDVLVIYAVAGETGTFQDWNGWRVCRQMRDVSLSYFRVQTRGGDADYYYEIPELEACTEFLGNRENILICGRPKSGKTRLAFEAMRRFPDAWLLYLLPNEGRTDDQPLAIPRVPSDVQRAFLFYDDLEKYGRNQDPEVVVPRLGLDRVSIVATVRSDPEYSKAKKLFNRALEFLHSVRIEDLAEEHAEEAAKGAGVAEGWRDGFDGTIGSIMLGIDAKRQVYEDWDEDSVSRVILRACMLLRKCGVVTYDAEEVRALCEHVFLLPCSEREWRNGVHILGEASWLTRGEQYVESRGEIEVYDAFLDQIVEPDLATAFGFLDVVRLILYWTRVGNRQRLDAVADSWRWEDDERALLKRALRRCLSEGANSALCHHLAAEIAEYDDEEEEIAERKEAATAEPDNAEWAYRLGQALAAKDDPEAESWLRAALELAETSEHAKALADYLFGRADRRLDAAAYYRRAVALDPTNGEARWALASLLIETSGLTEEARGLAIQAMEDGVLDAWWLSPRDVPAPLLRMRSWRIAWGRHQLRRMLEGDALWAADELRAAEAAGRMPRSEFLDLLSETVTDHLGKPTEGALLTDAASGLREIPGVFNGTSLASPVTGFCLDTLRRLHDELPGNGAVAESLVAVISDQIASAKDSAGLGALVDEARAVVGMADDSVELRFSFAWLLECVAARLTDWASHVQADRALDELATLLAGRDQEPLLSGVLAYAYSDCCMRSAEQGQLDRTEALLGRLADVADGNDDAGVRGSYAWGLGAAARANADAQNWQRMEDLVQTLWELSPDWGAEESDAEDALVDAHGDIAGRIGAAQAWERLDSFLATAEERSRAVDELPAQKALAAAVSASVLVYARDKNWPRADELLGQLHDLVAAYGEEESDFVGYWTDALSGASRHAGDQGTLDRLAELLEDLRDASREHDLKAARTDWASGMAVAVYSFARARDWTRVEDLLGQLRSLAVDHGHEEPDLVDYWTQALGGACEHAGDRGEFERLAQLLEALAQVAQEHALPAVRQNWAFAMALAIYDFGCERDWVRVAELLTRLKELAGAFAVDEPELRRQWARGLSYAVERAETSRDRQRSDDCLEELTGLVLDAKGSESLDILAEALAAKAYTLALEGDFERARDSLDRLDGLCVPAECGEELTAARLDLAKQVAHANWRIAEILAQRDTASLDGFEQLAADLYKASCETETDDNGWWGKATALEACLLSRDFQTAHDWALELCRAPDSNWHDETMLAVSLAGLGDWDSAGQHARSAVARSRYGGDLYWSRIWQHLWPDGQQGPPAIGAIKALYFERRL